MKEIQCKAMAAGFIHALMESGELRDRWVDVRGSKDWEKKLRVLIGETFDSDEPSADDLEKMRKHCDSSLGPELTELHQLDPRIESKYVCNGRDPHPPGH